MHSKLSAHSRIVDIKLSIPSKSSISSAADTISLAHCNTVTQNWISGLGQQVPIKTCRMAVLEYLRATKERTGSLETSVRCAETEEYAINSLAQAQGFQYEIQVFALTFLGAKVLNRHRQFVVLKTLFDIASQRSFMLKAVRHRLCSV